jgi:hypothetical protein
MVTANKEIKKPEDMKGMKLRVPPAPLFLMFTKSVGANATPIAFAEVYLALAAGHRRRPGKSAADHHGQEVLRGADAHHADRHITESLLTIVGAHVWSKLSDADKKVFEEVWHRQRPKRPTPSALRAEAADELRKLGKDRGRGRPRRVPQGGIAAAQRRLAGAGWSQAEYDACRPVRVSRRPRPINGAAADFSPRLGSANCAITAVVQT